MSKVKRWFVWSVMAGLLGGCDGLERFKVTPVDLTGQPLVGDWMGQAQLQQGRMTVVQRLYARIEARGVVTYVSLSCAFDSDSERSEASHLSLESVTVKRVTTQKMVLQNYPLTPQFELSIDSLPDASGQGFVLDQVPLSPISSADKPSPEGWQCAELKASL